MAASPPPSHVVIFPFMAHGHTVPLLDLSKAFSRRCLIVTIITTPLNAPTISKYIQTNPNIHIKEIPFPQTEGLPIGCENTSQLPTLSLHGVFVMATQQLQQPFEDILLEMSGSGSPPVCVISDFFLGWTVWACRKFGIPRYVFHGMGVLSMVITKSVVVHGPELKVGSNNELVCIPGLELPFTLTRTDIPAELLRAPDPYDPVFQFICKVAGLEQQSSGVIVNSFMELESEHVASLESFFVDGCKAWCVGPILLYEELEGVDGAHVNPSDPLIKWLDDRDTDRSVIFVSFGTQADVSDMQLDEIAYGLERSGHPFIWAVRSKSWAVPDGLEERIKGRGWIVRDWVDQRSILAHCRTGGFMSHCGWNSVLESLSVGIPILAWPMIAEQGLNARFVVEGLGAGIRVPIKHDGILAVDRNVICDVVDELMGSEKGKKVGEKAEELGELARQAVQKGGSSHKNFNELIDVLRRNVSMHMF